MKATPVSGIEWTVRLTRFVGGADSGLEAFERGWRGDHVEGEERHVYKLTLPGDLAPAHGKSEELRVAWEAAGWRVDTVSWRTRNRLPKPAAQLPLTPSIASGGAAPDEDPQDASIGKTIEAPAQVAPSAVAAPAPDPDADKPLVERELLGVPERRTRSA